MRRTEDVSWWNLGSRVENLAVTRKANQSLNPLGPVNTHGFCGKASPADRQITRQRPVMPGLVCEPGKVKQHAALGSQCIAKGAPVS